MSLKMKLGTVLLVLLIGLVANAQPTSSGTLRVGQPTSVELPANGTLTLDYPLGKTSQVSLQAISASAQVSLTILRDGVIQASEPNIGGEFTVTVNALLTAGDYVVQLQSLNNTTGTVILLVQSETAVSMTDIGLDTFVSETLDDTLPVALYRFGALPEAAYLYIESDLPQGGLSATVTSQNGEVVGMLGTGLTGVRFSVPLSSSSYTLQLTRADNVRQTPFTVCLTAISTRGCEFGSSETPSQPAATPVTSSSTPICTVTPTNAGGANIRQSASTGSIVVGALPGNQSADVLGISPDNQFFNIQYNTINGWVAQSVVAATGSCSGLPTVQPPAIIAPTNTPTPTPIPATPTPTGPCLVFINSPTFTYTTTLADPSTLFDQIQSGTVEAIGRTSNNQWWQVNYGPSWLQTSALGVTASTSGACHNLPIVTP